MDVSIIIVNYNTTELLINCIHSIYDKTINVKYEIIVVDNNSIKSPGSILLKLFPDVVFIQSHTNLGFGKANNKGVEYSNGKYLFFLNSDTILLNNAVYKLYDFLEHIEDNRIVAVGGNLFTVDNKPNFSYSSYFPSVFRIFLYRSKLNRLLQSEVFNSSGIPKRVSIIIGADLFVIKEIFLLVGGFDPKIFMYIEDGDLQYQFHKLGYLVYNLPSAKIQHLQGASSTTGEKLIMEFEGYYYYFKKNFSSLQVLFYVAVDISFALLNYVIFRLLNNRVKSLNYKKLFKFILHEYIFK